MKKIFLLFVLLSLFNCKKTDENIQKGDIVDQPGFNEKLNAYIAISNYMIDDYKGSGFSTATQRLVELYGSKDNPNLRQESPVTFLGNNYNWGIKMGVDPAIAINKEKPLIPKLDALELALCNQIISTNKKIDAFLAYYDQKEYLKDDYKNAATLHSEMMDQIALTYRKFDEASKELKIWTEKRDIAQLQSMKDKEKINYHLKFSVINAKAIMRELESQNASNENITAINTNNITQKLELLRQSSTELTNLINDKDELAKSGIDTMSTLGSFKSDLDKFIGDTNMLIFKVKKKQNFTPEELKYLNEKSPSQTINNTLPEKEGSLNALYNTLNKLIGDYNDIM